MVFTAPRIAVRLSLALVFACPAAGDTHYVDGTNPACPGHGTQTDPFCEIQRALDVAQSGDMVIVAAGIYAESLDFRGHDVLVVAPGGAANTVVDAGGQATVVSFVAGEGPGAVLDGFTLTGGQATYGGGIRIVGASPTIRNCQVLGNRADQRGGGLSLRNGGNPQIVRCDFKHNLAATGAGGGLYLDGSSALLEDCELVGNQAAGRGGGIYAENQAAPVIANTLLRGNRAGLDGGAFCLNGGQATLRNCELLENTAVGDGGGIHAHNGGTLTVEHSLVALGEAELGSGGGICLTSSSGTFTHVTVADNLAGTNGGGLLGKNSAQAAILNSIFWGNGPGEIVPGNGTFTVSYTDVEGGWAGAGNMGLNPLFWDRTIGDYHLGFGSPCIDAGDPASPPDDDGSLPDLGAYPFDPDHDGACGWYRYCSSSPNSVGFGAVIDFTGSISVSNNDLTLMAAVVPSNNWGKFFYSASQIQAPLGDGFLCAGAPQFRLPTVNSGPAGNALYALDISAPFQSAGTIVPGSNWNFQYWYRDPLGLLSSHNLSDALSITFCP
ncbi:MAG: hypothetical protein CMJ87_12405 [Planctomycetes bacterium]|nr:hypothetical protein [Planctomycetota bacterium]